jgi:hypothetical protein
MCEFQIRNNIEKGNELLGVPNKILKRVSNI